MTLTPHERKVLVAYTEAELDSMTAQQRSRVVNKPGLNFFVLDGGSRIDKDVVSQILDTLNVNSGSVLIQNPFDSSSYFLEQDAAEQIAVEKTVHVAHICHLLGSTSFRVTQVSVGDDEEEVAAEGKGGAKGVVAQIRGESKKARSFRRKIELSDKSSGGEPDVAGARAYVEQRHLSNDRTLTGLVEARAVTNNVLEERTLVIDATREARSSLDIAADLGVAGVVEAGGKGGKKARSFDSLSVKYEITF